jgi:hypothetical protein
MLPPNCITMAGFTDARKAGFWGAIVGSARRLVAEPGRNLDLPGCSDTATPETLRNVDPRRDHP